MQLKDKLQAKFILVITFGDIEKPPSSIHKNVQIYKFHTVFTKYC